MLTQQTSLNLWMNPSQVVLLLDVWKDSLADKQFTFLNRRREYNKK